MGMMKRAAAAALCLAVMAVPAQAATGWKLVSTQVIGGFSHPSSVACDTFNIYVSDLGPSADPTAADTDGTIVRIEYGTNDKIVKRAKLKIPEALHRPSGLYLFGEKMWFMDMNELWELNLDNGRAEKTAIPDIKTGDYIGSDVAAHFYISDTKNDTIVWKRISDFMDSMDVSKTAQFVTIYHGQGLHPAAVNGRFHGGGIFIFPTSATHEPQPVYFMPHRSAQEDLAPTYLLPPPKPHTKPFGSYGAGRWIQGGALYMTDMASGSLVRWTESGGFDKLATGFGEPVSFCLARHRMSTSTYKFVVADKAKGEVKVLWFQTAGL